MLSSFLYRDHSNPPLGLQKCGLWRASEVIAVSSSVLKHLSPSCPHSSPLNWRSTTFSMSCSTWCPSTCFGKEVRLADYIFVPPPHASSSILRSHTLLRTSWDLALLLGWVFSACMMSDVRHWGDDHRWGLQRVWGFPNQTLWVSMVQLPACHGT